MPITQNEAEQIANQIAPIIDQHNFRGMNALLRKLRPAMRIKKKPSNWADIINLKDFSKRLTRSHSI